MITTINPKQPTDALNISNSGGSRVRNPLLGTTTWTGATTRTGATSGSLSHSTKPGILVQEGGPTAISMADAFLCEHLISVHFLPIFEPT